MNAHEMRFARPRMWLGYWLRRIADRVDWWGAPRAPSMSFTIEQGKGVVFHQDRTSGCPLWFHGYGDYEKAYKP